MASSSMKFLEFCQLVGRLKHLPRTGWLRYADIVHHRGGSCSSDGSQKKSDSSSTNSNSSPTPESLRASPPIKYTDALHGASMGHIIAGHPVVEPIAGHMYRMALLAFCLDSGYENQNQSCSQGQKHGTRSHQGQKLDREKCIKMALVHDLAESIVGDITPHDNVTNEQKIKMENEAFQHIASLLPKKVGQEMYDLWREYEAQASFESKMVKQLDRYDLICQAFEYEKRAKRPKMLQEFFDSSAPQIVDEPMVQWLKDLLLERTMFQESVEKESANCQSSSDEVD